MPAEEGVRGEVRGCGLTGTRASGSASSSPERRACGWGLTVICICRAAPAVESPLLPRVWLLWSLLCCFAVENPCAGASVLRIILFIILVACMRARGTGADGGMFGCRGKERGAVGGNVQFNAQCAVQHRKMCSCAIYVQYSIKSGNCNVQFNTKCAIRHGMCS